MISIALPIAEAWKPDVTKVERRSSRERVLLKSGPLITMESLGISVEMTKTASWVVLGNEALVPCPDMFLSARKWSEL